MVAPKDCRVGAFRVRGLGFGAWGLGFRVQGLGFKGLGFRAVGHRFWDLGLGWGLGFGLRAISALNILDPLPSHVKNQPRDPFR